MNAPGIYNFTVYKGVTLRKTFVYKPGGVVADLTGYAAVCNWRAGKVLDSTSPLVSLTVGGGGVIMTPSDGKVEIYMPHTSTIALNLTAYYYFIHLIAPNTDVLPFLEGKITMGITALP